MKYNLADYFAPSPEELAEFQPMDGDFPGCSPPEDGFERLMAVKDASERLDKYRRLQDNPTSWGQIVGLIADVFEDNRFRLAEKFGAEVNKWREVLLGVCAPDVLPPKVYADAAKAFGLSFELVREALLGSYQIAATGSSASGVVHTRSAAESKHELAGAVEELLRKGYADKMKGADAKQQRFLDDVKRWMA